MEGFSVPALIKKVASGEKTHKDLTRAEAYWIMGEALADRLTDLQLGALLTALRLKGESEAELAGFLEAVTETGQQVCPPPSDKPLVAHCGCSSGKGRFFLSEPGAALLAAAAGVRVVICGRAGSEGKSAPTEVDVFQALGVKTDWTAPAVAEILESTGLGVSELRMAHPRLSRMAALRQPLGMRTVAQSLEKLVFPVRPTAALAGVFHLDYLRRLVQAAAVAFEFPVCMLQMREGAVDPVPASPIKAFLTGNGKVSGWEITPEAAGILPQPKELLGGLGVEESAELTRQLLAGTLGGAHQEMLLYNAGLLVHLGRPDQPLVRCTEMARYALETRSGLQVLERLRQVSPLG